MRLIDADALRSFVEEEFGDNVPYEWAWALTVVDHTPTIDAVPVVRCKDCQYRDEAKVNKKGFLICPASGMEITDDDFCSYGERRSDDNP